MKGLNKKGRQVHDLIVALISSKVFLVGSFVWFAVQGLFFAITIRVGLPPDENYHLSLIKLFSEHSPSPFLADQDGYLALGEVVHTPFFLYHYLMSFPYLLVGDSEWGYVVLRLLNLALALGSMYLVYRIAGELKVSKLVRNLSIFMLVNTLMFVFLSAAVSYDNLFIFLSLATILFLLRLLKGVTAYRFLLFGVAMAAGSLIKVNFLPVAFICLAVLIFRYRNRFSTIWPALSHSFMARKRLNSILGIVLGVLTILVIQRYGYNVLKYHTYAPSCPQVQTLQECRRSPLFVRNEHISRTPLRATKDPFEYVYDWVPLIQARTYGIFAHRELPALKLILAWSQILIVLGVVAIARVWRREDKLLTLTLGISLFYVAIVLLENYGAYTSSGRFGFALHGRYLFAVLPLLYVLGNHYTLKLLRDNYTKTLFLAVTIAVFFAASLPTFIYKSSELWYADRFKQTRTYLLP